MEFKWPEIKIEDLLEDKKNALAMGPFGSRIKTDNFVESGVPILKGQNLTEGWLNEKEFSFLTEEKAEELKSSSACRGDLIFTHRGTLGQVGYIHENSKFQKYIVSQSQMKLSLDKMKVLPLFVYYFFQSPIGQHRLLSNTSQTGVPAISRPVNTLKKIKIPIPSLDIQKKIVLLLSKLDHKISYSKDMIANIDQLTQILFQRWFKEFEFPNEDGDPYKSSGGKLIESSFGLIPEDWEIKEIGDVLELSYGKPLKRENRIPGIYPVYGSNGIVDYHNKALVEGPGIIIGRKGTVGTVNLEHEDFYPIDTAFYVTRKNKDLNWNYLFLLLTFQNFADLSGDSAVPGLNRNHAYKNKFLLPKNSVVYEFDTIIDSFFMKIYYLKKEIEKLAEIKTTLLPKLLTGEIELPDETEVTEHVSIP